MDNLTLTFTGDIGFDHYMAGKWTDSDLISSDILKFLSESDHVIANVEGPVSSLEKAPLENSVVQMMHTIDPAACDVLKKMNADIWNINNNHIMDAGEKGVADTLEEAAKAGVKTVGAGMNLEEAARPLFFEDAGGIGMFSVGYRRGCKPAGEEKAGCLLWNEMEIIGENIRKIKEKCRWCIVIAHGGEEFTSLPSPYTRDRYIKYLEMGADIVVCHHPHVPMNYETFPGKAIFYSLGNFIFDTEYQRAQFNTEKGIVLKLRLSKEKFDFEALGIEIERGPEHIVKADLPLIFRDVDSENYEKLEPLSAKAFVEATKKQQIFLKPAEYSEASEEKWQENFMNPKRSGRVEGEALDFQIICPIAEEASKGAWKESSLEDVKEYILRQLKTDHE